MIIFGTRGVTTTPQTGNFSCPTCRSQQQYGLRRVRRFFTLYFIPVIPLDMLGEYVECLSCKDTYKTTILDYDPNQDNQEIEAEYNTAIKKVMIHMLLADGVIDDGEVKMVQDIYEKITGSELAEDKLRQEIKAMENSKEDFSAELNKLQGLLNDEGKELVIRAALFVAMADGEFQEEEQQLLAKIGQDLGMTMAHIQGVINSA